MFGRKYGGSYNKGSGFNCPSNDEVSAGGDKSDTDVDTDIDWNHDDSDDANSARILCTAIENFCYPSFEICNSSQQKKFQVQSPFYGIQFNWGSENTKKFYHRHRCFNCSNIFGRIVWLLENVSSLWNIPVITIFIFGCLFLQ